MPSPDLSDKPSKAFVWLERVMLGAGMAVIAAVLDRLLVRTLRKGEVKPAPRTAAGPGESEDVPGQPSAGAEERHAVLTPPPKQVADQPGR
jgi:hypothetical protein